MYVDEFSKQVYLNKGGFQVVVKGEDAEFLSEAKFLALTWQLESPDKR